MSKIELNPNVYHRAKYQNSSEVSINDITESGVTRTYVNSGSADANYLGYYGDIFIQNFVNGYAQGTLQIIIQAKTGYTLYRYKQNIEANPWTYDDILYGPKIKYNAEGIIAPQSNGIYLDAWGNMVTQQKLTSGNWHFTNGSDNILQCNYSDNSIRTRGVYPQASGTYYLGSTGLRYAYGYINEVWGRYGKCFEGKKGMVSVTPTAANTDTQKIVSFGTTFGSTPSVYVTYHGSSTAVQIYGSNNVSTTQFTLHMTRNNITNTDFNWLALW